MKTNYTDRRRKDRLGERTICLRNKDLVKKLDAYCLLADIKIIAYVEEAIEQKLMFDIDNMIVQNKQEKELKDNK